jgi:hypothetical protein
MCDGSHKMMLGNATRIAIAIITQREVGSAPTQATRSCVTWVSVKKYPKIDAPIKITTIMQVPCEARSSVR